MSLPTLNLRRRGPRSAEKLELSSRGRNCEVPEVPVSRAVMKHKEKYPGIGKTPPLIFFSMQEWNQLEANQKVKAESGFDGLRVAKFRRLNIAICVCVLRRLAVSAAGKAINSSRDIAYGPFEVATGLESESAIRTYHLPRIFGEPSDNKNLNKIGRLEGEKSNLEPSLLPIVENPVTVMSSGKILSGFILCSITDKNVSSAVLRVASPYGTILTGTMRGTLRARVDVAKCGIETSWRGSNQESHGPDNAALAQ
ncbi:hypothetical protein R3P38DRAFT_2803461 [Favolaschia claudopus]|uniref:Uncharacterized protein n=1 Tax=Favolaschia claudopus TaxID=2862362 RepID=A0AAV9ZSN0_9AGAR